jgi:hypothetical protein
LFFSKHITNGNYYFRCFVGFSDWISCSREWGLVNIVQGFWLWQFPGQKHPMIEHFPVSLLVVALILQATNTQKEKPGFGGSDLLSTRMGRGKRRRDCLPTAFLIYTIAF